jgi:hypothetical protein
MSKANHRSSDGVFVDNAVKRRLAKVSLELDVAKDMKDGTLIPSQDS